MVVRDVIKKWNRFAEAATGKLGKIEVEANNCCPTLSGHSIMVRDTQCKFTKIICVPKDEDLCTLTIECEINNF